MEHKATLQKELFFSGIGVHGGRTVHMALRPSYEGCLLFERSDLGGASFSPDPRKVESPNCTVIKADDVRIQTVEHLLAVLYAFGIDSLEVELDGDEIPILDGSAEPFAEAVAAAGIRSLPGRKQNLAVLESFTVSDGRGEIRVSPSTEFSIRYRISFDHPAIGEQDLEFSVTPEAFVRDIAPARTFGFLKDVEALRSRGLALGGSLDNALVLDEAKVINGPLRFTDEFVRHKILDLIGDLALLGQPVLGHFDVYSGGHVLHQKAVRFLLDHPGLYRIEG
ncbi:MAG: UDP-3-O-acyl-N-acetylglucosamine deacetylase [Acidobacteriota bacterium]